MIPGNELSSVPHIAPFSYPVKSTAPEDRLQDWELGGIGLSDPSVGLLYQLWTATLVIDEDTDIGSIYVEAPNTPPVFQFSGLGIRSVGLAFDQNMHVVIAYEQLGIAKLFWWDPTVLAMVHTNLPVGARTPACCLDEHRLFNIADSDVIVIYNRGGSLYMLYQRDRYSIEYFLKTTTEDAVYIGMNTVWSVQMGLGVLL